MARQTPRPTARKRLAKAIADHATEQAESEGRRREYAVVHSVDPLQVELHGSGLVLDEDDLVVTQGFRRLTYDSGLDVGDTVVVDRMPNDDFLVSDVVGTGKAELGLDLDTIVHSSDPTFTGPNPGVGGVTVTMNHHILKKVTLRADDGTVIGYVPIYGTLPA